MIRSEEVFQIGRFTRTHGIHGELELQFTDDAFDRGAVSYLVLLLDGIFVPFFWKEYRFKKNDSVLMLLEDIESEEAARRLVGVNVYYPHAARSVEDEETLSSLQALTGFTLLVPNMNESTEDADLATYEVGKIMEVATQTANTLLTVQTEAGGEILLPYHDDFLLTYNIRERYILLQLPEGLLELNTI